MTELWDGQGSQNHFMLGAIDEWFTKGLAGIQQADDSVGYEYPQSYIRLFGADFKPEPYVDRAHEYARNHKYYMSARLLTVNDLGRGARLAA